MYISRMKLNLNARHTMRALAEPKLFHGAIEAACPGPRQRNLWRIDSLGQDCYMMMVTPELPDLAAAVAQYGFPDGDPAWESKDYTPLLQRIQPGTHWHFRLTANPVHHSAGNAQMGERGKVLAHVTSAHQQQWLKDKAPSHGFLLEDGAFLAINSQQLRFRKGTSGPMVTLQSVTFEGELTVTDAELFVEALTKGIGRGKAYGMGMMTVVRQERMP